MASPHRRKSDEWQYRAAVAMMVLTSVLCFANSVISGYTIWSLMKFNKFIDDGQAAINRMNHRGSPGPDLGF